MKEIQTKSGKILCVEIPEDVTWWESIENILGSFLTKVLDLPQYFLQYGKVNEKGYSQVYYNSDNFYLPKGKWNIIGKLSELTDKDCEEFVDKLTFMGTGLSNAEEMYKFYLPTVSFPIISAKESFISLLESEGVDVSKEYLIIRVL